MRRSREYSILIYTHVANKDSNYIYGLKELSNEMRNCWFTKCRKEYII